MSVIAETIYGTVRGFSSDRVNKWFGIPYAKAPVGDLRFRKPELPDAWEGIKETTQFAPKCPQLAIPVNPDNGLLQSEDCLYLNIWAPENAKDCPVLFWIYGGSFAAGEGSDCVYDGTSFAKNGGVVVVTFNYRVGLFGGFYNFGNDSSLAEKYTENVGIYDCIAALKWVNENIAAFGGNPRQIIVAGESAGAVIVTLLLHMPELKGLFQRAILESIADLPFTDKKNTYMAQNILSAMGLKQETANQLCLMAEEEIMDKLKKLTGNNALLSGAGCVIDGLLVRGSLCEILKDQESADVPILAGTNHDEGVIFVNPSESWNDQAKMQMKVILQATDLEDSEKTFSYYSPLSDPNRRVGAFTDRMFCLPTKMLLDKQGRKTSVYAYEFDYATPEAKAAGMNAFHSAEMAYVFHNIAVEAAVNASETENDKQNVSDQMHGAWIRFINEGNPGWTAYNDEAAYFVFDERCREEYGYADHVEEVWK